MILGYASRVRREVYARFLRRVRCETGNSTEDATAGTCEEMFKRANYAAQIGVPIIMHEGGH